MARCENCVFWEKGDLSEFPEKAECVRLPPVAKIYHDSHRDIDCSWQFPVTRKDQWCGEFRDRWVNGNPPMFRD